MTTQNLSGRLRAARLRLGFTQAAFAQRLDLPTITYRSYETGRSVAPVSLYDRLHHAGLDAIYIVTGLRPGVAVLDGVDWNAILRIALEIHRWSNSRRIPVDPDLQARYLELGYALHTEHGERALEELAVLFKAA